MRRLRVLHAITMLELGGAQRNTLDTVAALASISRYAVLWSNSDTNRGGLSVWPTSPM